MKEHINLKIEEVVNIKSDEVYEKNVGNDFGAHDYDFYHSDDVTKKVAVYPDDHLISLDDFQALLDKVKESGSTHIKVKYRIDRQCYDLYGYKVSVFTDEDEQVLKEAEDAENKRKNQEKIASLEAEIEKLKGK